MSEELKERCFDCEKESGLEEKPAAVSPKETDQGKLFSDHVLKRFLEVV